MAVTIDGTTGITTPGLTNTGTEILVDLTTTGNTTIGNLSTDTLVVGVNGIVKDTFGNVGIGTASPSGKFHVAGTNNSLFTSAAGTSYVNLGNADGATNAKYTYIAGASGYLLFGRVTDDLSTRTETMRIDSSGNLGLGVTPSAWSSGIKALELQNGGSIYNNGTNDLRIGNNIYINSSVANVYKANGYATWYEQVLGTHVWQTAANNVSGSGASLTPILAMTLDASSNLRLNPAGGTVGFFAGPTSAEAYFQYNSDGSTSIGTRSGYATKFLNGATQVMTLDSAGNLGINEPSPVTYANGLTVTDTAVQPEISLRTNTTLSSTSALKLGVTSSIPQGGAVISSIITSVSGQNTDMIFSTIAGGVLTAKMILDANGRVGIGTTSPASRLSATATRHGNADGLSAHLNALQWEVNGQGYASVVSNIASVENNNAGLLVKLGSTGATDKILDLESGGVNRVRVLGNGNVGIGVTPSAWSSGKVVEIGNYGNSLWNNGASENHLTTNSYYNSGWKFGGTGYAQKLTTVSGQYQFHVSTASGTAGNAITFTQAMTLDASGNLGIGTGSNALAGKLEISAGTGAIAQRWSYTADPVNYNLRLYTVDNGASDVSWYFTHQTNGANTNVLSFKAGNVGIGNNVPVYKLDVGPVSSSQSATVGASGLIRNSAGADTSPFTQARIIVYGGTNVDTANWGYLAYGSDATMRVVYGKTGSSIASLAFVTSSATDGTGSLSEKARFDTTGNLLLGTNSASTPSTTGYASVANTFGFKNRIINGAMVIDQRNAGASTTPAGTYTLDRWQGIQSGATSKFSLQQNAGSVTPPTGFTKYAGITSLSAYAVTSADYYQLKQIIEGYNVADLSWGTASASSITVSFWVRSSLTGSFGLVISWGSSGANQRSYPILYTISATNTWEFKTIIIPGDTTMAAGGFETGSGASIQLRFSLGGGATSAGPSGSWATANYQTVTGDTSVVGTNGATWYVTGVQLEKGTVASSFDWRPYGTELQLCQRYYEKSYNQASVPGSVGINTGEWVSVAINGTDFYDFGKGTFKVTKRTAAAMVIYSTDGTINTFRMQDASNVAATVRFASENNFSLNGAAMTAAQYIRAHWTASAEL